jgi:hypothetical protein
VFYIPPAIFLAQRQYAAPDDNPLLELPKFPGIQLVFQLRLPHENNLQQLCSGGFQVGEQARLLQGFHAQMLSLIDKDRQVLVSTQSFYLVMVELASKR